MRACAAALVLLVSCKPEVRGRCSQNSDCDTAAGVFCDESTNICIAASGTCTPACGPGQLCSGGVCANLKPAAAVQLPSDALLSPAFPDVKVHVEASPELTLHGLSVEVIAASNKVASGAIAQAVNGDNTVALTDIHSGVAGAVSVAAVLAYGDGESVRSVAVPATIDAASPAVTLSIAPPGWVVREGDPLTVTAAVDDGAGSGPLSAALKLDGCESCAAVQGQLSGSTFTFQVPRTVQATGSEAAIAFTVTVLDRAQNHGAQQGSLQIDDAAPQIGAVATALAGANGEDGTSPWFPGGPGAQPVEIAVPVSDMGSGFASMSLQIDGDDVPPGTNLAPSPNAPGDGTVHFLLPAQAVTGEGPLRYTLTAKDVLQHTSTKDGAIYVDALPPQISQPLVDYAHATPDLATVCNDAESAGFACGRRGGAALLRDDGAQVTFDAIDCGAGLGNGTSRISAAIGTSLKTVTVTGKSAGACANGSTNQIHHYSFSISAGTDVDAPGAADDAGLAQVQISANAADKTSNGTSRADGSAAISLWRWKRQLSGASNITGAPAIVPTTKQIAVVTDANNKPLFFLHSDGSPPGTTNQNVGVPLSGDVATGPGGNVYVLAPAAPGELIIVAPSGDVAQCGTRTGTTLNAAPVVASIASVESAIVVATGRTNATTQDNFFIYQIDSGGSCNLVTHTNILTAPADFTGLSANSGGVFASHAQGFSSYDNAGANGVNYKTALAALAPPSLLGSNPLFAETTNKTLHKTAKTTCAVVGTCWDDVSPTFAAAASGLPFTPVFDANAAWDVDDSGKVYRWLLKDGTQQAALLTAVSSGPVLLQDGSALVVQKDGPVQILSTALAPLKLANVGAFGATPAAPVIEARGSYGVAYVPAPSGWVYAVQTPAPPAQAGSSVWPRPGRDSCNSRNASSTCP